MFLTFAPLKHIELRDQCQSENTILSTLLDPSPSLHPPQGTKFSLISQDLPDSLKNISS